LVPGLADSRVFEEWRHCPASEWRWRSLGAQPDAGARHAVFKNVLDASE
jgi:hypothetical protein